jgi:hypothetical protein
LKFPNILLGHYWSEGNQILADLSADVLRSKGKNGCHFTETTLSSWLRVFTRLRLFKSDVSVITIYESNPALAKYLPSTEKLTPLASD